MSILPLLANDRRGAAAAAYIAILIASGTLLTRGVASRRQDLTAYAELNERSTVARLSCLPYLPAPQTNSWKRTSSVRAAAEQVLASDVSVNERAAAAMLLGRTRAAITLLEKALRTRAGDPAAWSDLAAVRYEDGRATQDHSSYISALAATDRALDLQPHDPAALFNRALILDAIGFRKDAAETFRQALASDRKSVWAHEIQLRALAAAQPNDSELWKVAIPSLEKAVERRDSGEVERIVLRFPQFARAWAEGEFPARWAEASLAGNADAAKHWLNVTRAVGYALRRTSGESIVDAIGESIHGATPATASLLAEAHLAYRHARQTYHQRDVTAALPLLRDAERRFVQAQSPAAFGAALFIANASFDAHAAEEAAAIHRRLLKNVPAQYAALHAQLNWLHALLTGWSGEPFESAQACLRAMEEFDRLGERENGARMRSMFASLLATFGDDAEAGRYLARAFVEAAQSGNPKTIEVALNHAARDEMANRNWEIARALLRLQLAHTSVSSRMAFDVRMALAFVDAELSGHAPDFRDSAVAASAITDQALRTDALDVLAFGRATYLQHDPKDAIRLLNEVIDYRKSLGRLALLRDPLVERARAYRELGNEPAAEADLQEAISLVAKSGAGIQDKTLRDLYMGVSRDAYSELAELLFAGGRVADAFRVADQGRARGVAERMNSLPPSEQTVEALQRRLPDDTVVAHYSALRNNVVIMIVERSTWNVATARLSRVELEALTDRHQREIRDDDLKGARDASSKLHRYLIAPLMSRLTSGKKLVIIPDASTSGIAFGALPAPDGSVLLSRTVITLAPSAAVAFRDRAASRKKVTVVTDPAFDAAIFPTVKRLPAGRRDATFLENLFPAATVLGGSSATTEAVLPALRESTIIHIAAHAFSNANDATRSFVLLAPGLRDSGALYSRDIAQLDLIESPLVILAGCRTSAAGGGSGSIRSLALAFMAAGGGAVVAALWDVDDASSSSITRTFYQEIVAGQDAAAALRSAQLTAIRRGIPARDWAAFQIYSTRLTKP